MDEIVKCPKLSTSSSIIVGWLTQVFFQLMQCPENTVSNGAIGFIEPLGDIGRCESVQVTQGQNEPVFFWQFPEALEDGLEIFQLVEMIPRVGL